jgi:hypothetical protein
MSNNLKEKIEKILTELENTVSYDSVQRVKSHKSGVSPKVHHKKALETLYTLINQKEKEAEIRGLENLLDGSAEGATCICESAGLSVCDHNWSLCNVVRDRIKQLKEELNKKG